MLLTIASTAMHTLPAPPCTVTYPVAFTREASEVAASVAVDYARITAALLAPPLERCTIEMTGVEASDTAATSPIPPWAAGAAWPESGLIRIRAGRLGIYPLRRLRSVVAHELAHLVMWQAAGSGAGAALMPPWFREGTAGLLAREGEWADFVHLWASPLPSSNRPLASLDDYFSLTDHPARIRAAYAGSYLFLQFASRRHDDRFVARVLEGLRLGLDFNDAWRRAAGGAPLAVDEAAWGTWLGGRTRWAIIATSTGALWMAVTLLMVAAWWIKRRRSLRTLATWPDDAPPPAGIMPPS